MLPEYTTLSGLFVGLAVVDELFQFLMNRPLTVPHCSPLGASCWGGAPLRAVIGHVREGVGPERPDEVQMFFHTYIALLTLTTNESRLSFSFQGKHEEAEPLYMRTLAIDEKVYGPDHSRVAQDLFNLAGSLEGQVKAVTIFSGVFGAL